MKQKHRIAVMIAGLAVALSVGSYVYWQNRLAERLPEGTVSSNGRIEAERVDVATKLPGRIAEVLVDEGQWVEAGTIVARMDTAELDAQLRQAQAMVVQAEKQEIQVTALVRQRRAELQFAEAESTRAEKLAANGHATQELVDKNRATLAAATTGVAAAEAGVELASASIAAAQAAVDRVQSTIRDATLVAPRTGRVQYRLAEPGEVIGAGGKVLTITDLTAIYMTIFLPARDAGLLTIGDEARLILDPIPDYVIPASVTFVASTAQFTPKSVETSDERDKLMFRVKLSIPPELLAAYQDRAKAGVEGTGYVRTDPKAAWPASLEIKLPQ